MDHFYTAIIGIDVFYLLIMALISNTNTIMQRRERNVFVSTFLLLIVVNVAEWAGFTLNNADPSLIKLHAFVKAIEYSTGPFVAVYLGSSLGHRRPPKVITILLVLHTLLEIASMFFGFIFTVGADNVYHRAEWYPIYILAYIGSIVYLFVNVILMELEYQRRNGILMMLICLFLVFCSGIQIVWSGIRVAWMTTGMAAGLFYLCYGNLLQQVDSVTKLLNRSCYRSSLADLHGDALIVMMDLDSFKEINDRYGHSRGDQCLAVYGRLVKEIFTPHGLTFRIGGDEFCAILTSGSDADAICAKLHEAVQDEQAKGEMLPGFSAGWSQYHHGSESVLDAIDRADAMMYGHKRLAHEKGSLQAVPESRKP